MRDDECVKLRNRASVNGRLISVFLTRKSDGMTQLVCGGMGNDNVNVVTITQLDHSAGLIGIFPHLSNHLPWDFFLQNRSKIQS